MSLTGSNCREQTRNLTWCNHPTKNLPGLALPLEQRRHSQSLILKDGECEWKQDSLFRLCAFIIVKWERDRTLVSYCVRRGRANSSVLAACRSWNSAACPSHLSQCRAVPDTGRLSDRRPLWSVCQVLIWANIEEHSAIASMIAAGSPLWAAPSGKQQSSQRARTCKSFQTWPFPFSPTVHKISSEKFKKVHKA